MTLHIQLDPSLEASLNFAAQSEGLSVEDFVRGCLRKQLVDAEPAAAPNVDEVVAGASAEDSERTDFSLAYNLGKDVFGKRSSGRADLSERHEEILGEIFDEKHRSR